MTGITQAQAESILETVIEAYNNFSGAGTATVPGGRTITFRTAQDLERAIDYWNQKVIELSRGGITVKKIDVP